MKISEAFSEYVRFAVVLAGKSPRTAESYRNTMALCVNFFGDVEIEKITEKKILLFFESLNRLATNSARMHIIHLRKILQYMRKKGFDLPDPENFPIPKRAKNRVEYLDDEQISEFIAASGRSAANCPKSQKLRNLAIVTVLFDSGLRVGELVGLNRSSIRNRQFSVVGKSKEPRVVFISDRAEKAIAEYLATRRDTQPALFLSPNTGKRISVQTVQEIFRNTSRRCGISAHPHTARHSFATKLLRRKVDIFYIAQLLGHQSLDTTKQYLHYENPVLREIYEGAMAT